MQLLAVDLMLFRRTFASLYIYCDGADMTQNIFGILKPLFENYQLKQN